MATTDPRLTALKIAYKGELHRVRVDLAAFEYDDLAQLFADTFALAPGSFVVQYMDADGDVLNVTSQAEYVEACRVFLATSEDAAKSLRFSAVSRTQVLFQENVADPILKALERLVETLTDALNKVKQEEWAQRAQAGVQVGLQHAQAGVAVGLQHAQTGVQVGLQHAQAGLVHTEEWAHRAQAGMQAGVATGIEKTEEFAQRAQAGVHVGLNQTSDVLNRAANDAREGLTAARQSIQEIPFDQILKETGENLKAAADHLQTFAHEVVGEMKKINLNAPTETQTDAVPPPMSDPEWERVDEQTTVVDAVPITEPAVAVPEPEVVQVVAPSAEEVKWANEIAQVRDIFPDVDTQRVIDNLEHCNGNVHVVLNSLMEDM